MPGSHSIVRIRGLPVNRWSVKPRGLHSLPKPTVCLLVLGLHLSPLFRPFLTGGFQGGLKQGLLKGLFPSSDCNPTHPPLRHL